MTLDMRRRRELAIAQAIAKHLKEQQELATPVSIAMAVSDAIDGLVPDMATLDAACCNATAREFHRQSSQERPLEHMQQVRAAGIRAVLNACGIEVPE